MSFDHGLGQPGTGLLDRRRLLQAGSLGYLGLNLSTVLRAEAAAGRGTARCSCG